MASNCLRCDRKMRCKEYERCTFTNADVQAACLQVVGGISTAGAQWTVLA